MWYREVRRLLSEERGMQHVEEALMVALIALAAVSSMSGLRDSIRDAFQGSSDAMLSVIGP
jgi:Flp pilus assembly pilin Flp